MRERPSFATISYPMKCTLAVMCLQRARYIRRFRGKHRLQAVFPHQQPATIVWSSHPLAVRFSWDLCSKDEPRVSFLGMVTRIECKKGDGLAKNDPFCSMVTPCIPSLSTALHRTSEPPIEGPIVPFLSSYYNLNFKSFVPDQIILYRNQVTFSSCLEKRRWGAIHEYTRAPEASPDIILIFDNAQTQLFHEITRGQTDAPTSWTPH